MPSGSLCENPTWKKNLGTNLTLKQSTEELPGCDFSSNTGGVGAGLEQNLLWPFLESYKNKFPKVHMFSK